MADIRVPADHVAPFRAHLAAHYGAAARIAEEMPDPEGTDPWTIESPAPLIVVSDDSGPTLWPIYTKPLVRFTVYANGLQLARWLRRRTMGAVFASDIAGVEHIDKTGIGYTEARDTRTGADLASFTVTATVRTEVVTV